MSSNAENPEEYQDAAKHEDQKVTPYTVDAGSDGVIDYDRLVRLFGCLYIEEDLISRMERLTNRRAHRFLRRGKFFTHRDLKEILDRYERGMPFYLYTGRGPSSDAMHMGHMIPFTFTKWMQDAFNVPLVIQITDDEKFFWKDLTLERAYQLAIENIKDIIAVGFDVTKTFIFSDLEYVGVMYRNIVKLQKLFKFAAVRSSFGFDAEDSDGLNSGQIAYPAVQAAPSFCNSFPHLFGERTDIACLIPCAIDQDNYFRLTRKAADKLGYLKPALIHSRFFPALQGANGKMSSSDANSAIFLTDTPKQIKEKINAFAFSGGGDTKAQHEEHGADLNIDVPYQWLTFFLEDDEELKHIATEYDAGRMFTSQVKARLIEVLTDLVVTHQNNRRAVTMDVVRAFMAIRDMKAVNLPNATASSKQ